MAELNLHQKLVQIRQEIGVFTKDTKGHGYSYVSGSQVLEKIQAKMNELNVLLYPKMNGIADDVFNYTTSKGNAKTDFVIKGDMVYIWQNADDPKDALEVPWKLYGQQDDISKAYGSALTYSERYFLLKFFNAPTDDDDPDSRDTKGKYGQTSNKASEKQLNFVKKLLEGKINEKNDFNTLYSYLKQSMGTDVDIENWTSQQASQAIKILKGGNSQ
ncbi:hypothetical protein CAI16_05265 [Virgibacillus dokdonensis]|uniref:Single-stranded DNA-binding protein n=1 Tax=Virgibacillus dokdonensis TaxID=302167 RepID=A0A3E0WVI7_9BACI|nr:ERF family protein [Virgibacillus dokdonensis]RFA36203.1 hypothetical protein CAI16_05265 [Virgibacillus dokdonensis]